MDGKRMEIMQQILDELHARCAYRAEDYAPHYVASYAAHVFNMINNKKEIYWEAGSIPNQRVHLLFISPAGYMKSYFLDKFTNKSNGIFVNVAKYPIGRKQSMTEAKFTGTIQIINGQATTSDGDAFTYRDGILAIDEFSAITSAFKSQYNNQMDGQLLTALDSGNISKGLASGTIEYTTRLTLWAGVQPTRYDLDSGFGRRIWFLTYVPSDEENDKLHDAIYASQNVMNNCNNMAKLWRNIDTWVDEMDIIERVEFSQDFNTLKKSLKLRHYDARVFNFFCLGWYLAIYGPDKKMVIDAKDPELLRLIKQQTKDRVNATYGIDKVQMIKLIEMYGDIDSNVCKISNKSLYKYATTLGWDSKITSRILTDLVKDHRLSIVKGVVEMEIDPNE